MMLEVVYPYCAGLDVHKKTVVACRMKPGTERQVQQESKTFGTTTPELLEMVDWLMEWEITHVVMESTGVYWKPIYNLLEGNVEVWLVNAKHVKQVPGRKTDVKDAEWLAELLRVGLLKGSFIPPRPQRELRDLTRYRTKLVQERSREVNRVHKVLEDANIKLASVATDILGKSGREMLEALVAGQTDAPALADLAQRKLRKKMPELEQALTGLMRPHHRFLLAQHLARIDFTDEQIATLNQQIETQLAEMSSPAPPPGAAAPTNPPQASQTGLPPSQPWSAHQAIELLDTIPGVNQTIAQVIVAELGLDMSRFPSDKHAAAWAGLAPGNRQSAGKHYATNTREGNKALSASLTQAAWAAQRSQDTYLSALYRRLVGRRGKKRALVAVAHSILVSAYHMLSRREPYRELGSNYFDEHKKTAVINRLTRRLEKLGYNVHLETLPATA
jgi:transposase